MLLVDEWQSAGTYRSTFDGKMLPSGIYTVRLAAGDEALARRIVLVR